MFSCWRPRAFGLAGGVSVEWLVDIPQRLLTPSTATAFQCFNETLDASASVGMFALRALEGKTSFLKSFTPLRRRPARDAVCIGKAMLLEPGMVSQEGERLQIFYITSGSQYLQIGTTFFFPR